MTERPAVTLTIRGAKDLQLQTIEILAEWLEEQLEQLKKMNKKYEDVYEADFFTMEATFNDPNLFNRMMELEEAKGHA